MSGDVVSGEGAARPPASSGPAIAGPQRRGPATWLVVLLTLLVVGVVLLAFGAGVGVGFWAAGTTATTTTTTTGAAPTPVPAPAPAPTPAPTSAPEGGAGGVLDPCLVGGWRSTAHEESYDTEQGAATLTGLERTMTFEADGTQTITYDGSEATVTTEQGALPAVFDGSVVYDTRTAGSTMSFVVRSVEGTVTVLGPDGQVAQEDPIEPGTGDVTYSCDSRSLVQEAPGYRSVYERVG